MIEIETNTIPTTNESESKRESYPIKTFKSIEPFVGNVYKKYGSDALHSNEKIGDANNLAVNSIKQIISTCVQYGCLIKSHGKGYQISNIFTKIFHPENEEQKRALIVECLMHVPFYIPLFNDYKEKVVPSIEGLQNRFIRDYKMKNHLAKNAAEIFVQNLKDVQLLNARNVLIISTNDTPNHGEEIEKENTNKIPKNDFSEHIDKLYEVSVPIKLKGNRMATLSFPIDFTDDDLIKMYKVLKAYIEAYGEDIDLSKL